MTMNLVCLLSLVVGAGVGWVVGAMTGYELKSREEKKNGQ